MTQRSVKLFTRGRNAAARALTFRANSTAYFACPRATREHTTAISLLRCVAASMRLRPPPFPDEDLSSDADVVLSRSVLLLRNSLLPRHQLLCENSSQSCALLIAATRDLCRRHGSRLNVSLLGGGGALALDSRVDAVWRACPKARIRRAVPCGDDEVGWAHLVHIQIEEKGGRTEREAALIGEALVGVGSHHLAAGGALLCDGCIAATAHCVNGSLGIHSCGGADHHPPLLPRACHTLTDFEPSEGGGVLLAVDPIGEEEEAMEEEEEERLEAGGCSSSSSTHFFYPGYTPQPWEAHTYVISTSQRRRRWVGAAAAADQP